MLRKNKRKITALFLAAVLLLTGCGGENAGTRDGLKTADTGSGQAGAENPAPIGANGEWLGEGGCYKLEIPPVCEDVADIYMDGDTQYSVAIASEADPDRSNYSRTFTRYYKDTELIYELQDYACTAMGGRGCFFLEDITDYTADTEKAYRLLQIGTDGAVIAEKDVSGQIGDDVVLEMRQGGENKLYVRLDTRVLVFENTDFLCEAAVPKELISFSGGLVESSDGNMYWRPESGDAVYRIDTENGKLVLEQEYPGYRISNGGSVYLFTLTDEKGVYGAEKEGGDITPIVIFRECSIPVTGLRKVVCLPDGKFLLEDNGVGFALMVPADSSEITPRTVLKLATVMGELFYPQSFLADFNLQSSTYMIDIVDYSQNGALSITDATAALHMDILSGRSPDLIDLSGLTSSYYSDKGLLTDLYPLIDQDPDLKREDFYFLNQLEKDGGLYFCAPAFYIESAAGLYSRFGDRTGWSLEEYLETESQNDCDMMYNVTREGFLYQLARAYAQDHIDWEAGTCDFDTEEFIRILETAARIRENPEDEANPDFTPAGQLLHEGRMIASYVFIDGVEALQSMEKETGEKLSYLGRPTPDGTGGTMLEPSFSIAVCSKGNQEGGWEYIKFILSGRMKADFGISIRKDIVERNVQEAIRKGEESGKNQITGEMTEQFYDLIERAVYRDSVPQEALDIISEEAGPFFAGDKDAGETARIIQSRIGLMAAER